MATEFQMPKLGLTMEEGTITAWLVEPGTEVEAGTPVLAIETDKVESDVEASASGVLHITGQVGEVYACGELIGWLLEPGEEPPADASGPSPASVVPTASTAGPRSATAAGALESTTSGTERDGARLFASPNARRVAAERGVDLRDVIGSGPGGRIVSEDVPVTPLGRTMTSASPAARQTAERLGVDLDGVRPSRAGSPIDRADVERHVRDVLAGNAPSGPVPREAPLLQEPTRTIRLTGMRGTIARRMHASLAQMAQLTLTMDVLMDSVIAHRQTTDPDHRPGYTDYVLAAAADALVEHPIVNSQIADGAVHLLPEVNVGVAVAVDGGLLVPVVYGTNHLDFVELCAETSRLADAARAGELHVDEVQGATFSVTTLGMFGVDAFTPVINPPNTAILGVGRLRDGVRWVDGAAAPLTSLTLSLTWDHRAFDGVPAAAFAAAVRDRLEGWSQP